MEYQLLTKRRPILTMIEKILDQGVCRPDGGSKYYFIDCLADRHTIEKLALLIEGELVIGWAILFQRYARHEVHAFVRPSHRRQKIGTTLLSMVKFDSDDHWHCSESAPEFWRANKKVSQ